MNLHSHKKTAFLATIASLFTTSSLLAQSADYAVSGQSSGGGVGGAIGGLVWLVVAVVVIIGLWKVFVKAGQPGWASIIPIYNTYIICKIVGNRAGGCCFSLFRS